MRVRTFVDPEAPFGYATGVGEYCYERADAYGGVDDIVRQAKLIKEAGAKLTSSALLAIACPCFSQFLLRWS